jgi:hypothetical protein
VRRLREASTVEADRSAASGRWGTDGSLTSQLAYNGDGVRTSKTVDGDTTEYVLDLMATLPEVISDTEAVYLYGLDIIAQQQTERLYYLHYGLGSLRPRAGTRPLGSLAQAEEEVTRGWTPVHRRRFRRLCGEYVRDCFRPLPDLTRGRRNRGR